jgi:hypothetical protein
MSNTNTKAAAAYTAASTFTLSCNSMSSLRTFIHYSLAGTLGGFDSLSAYRLGLLFKQPLQASLSTDDSLLTLFLTGGGTSCTLCRFKDFSFHTGFLMELAERLDNNSLILQAHGFEFIGQHKMSFRLLMVELCTNQGEWQY